MSKILVSALTGGLLLFFLSGKSFAKENELIPAPTCGKGLAAGAATMSCQKFVEKTKFKK